MRRTSNTTSSSSTTMTLSSSSIIIKATKAQSTYLFQKNNKIFVRLLEVIVLLSFISIAECTSTATTKDKTTLSSLSSSSSYLRRFATSAIFSNNDGSSSSSSSSRRQLQEDDNTEESGDNEVVDGEEVESNENMIEEGSSSSVCPSKYLEPPVPGIREGVERPNIVLAVGAGEPPFTQLGSASDGFPLSGLVVDIGYGLKEVCDIDITFSQAPSATCFTSFGIGERLINGNIHGCSNYLRTPGMRNRQAEFTLPLVDNRIPGALLTRLDSQGIPAITGMDDLNGKTIIDVSGVVPNPDELVSSLNPCTGNKFSSNIQFITPPNPGDGTAVNDIALQYLLDGNGDGLWINARTPNSFLCSNVVNGTTPNYDCTLWENGLGNTYAFVQTGIPSTAISGTTLAMSKKGSGLSKILNPCIEEFLKTESYYNICDKYGFAELGIICFPNKFFPVNTTDFTLPNFVVPTNLITNTTTSDCSDGYCPCDYGFNSDDDDDDDDDDDSVDDDNENDNNNDDFNMTQPILEEEDETEEEVVVPSPPSGDDSTTTDDGNMTSSASTTVPADITTESNVPTTSPTLIVYDDVFLTLEPTTLSPTTNITTTVEEVEETTTTFQLEELCINTGGTVTTQSCCIGTEPFPSDIITVGACGCSPEDSEDVQICDCTDDNEAFITSWGCINLEYLVNCEDSGGVVQLQECCDSDSVQDFTNLCFIGACSCGPSNTKPILTCQCSNEQCWNGQNCVERN